MNKFTKVTLSEEQTEEWSSTLIAIAEDNEKHRRSALYFLVSGAECSFKIINLGKEILKTKKYPKDINCFCSCNLYFAHVHKIKNNKEWIPEKEKEITNLYNKMLGALDLFDRFDQDIKFVAPNIKVQRYILKQYDSLIEYIITKENLREIFSKVDKKITTLLLNFIWILENIVTMKLNFS